MNKLPELLSRHSTHCWDLIAITETWLTEDILDSEISLPGMRILRRDRPSKGGGVLLYYRQDLSCSLMTDPYLELTDTLWCCAQLQSADLALIGIIYRPPNSSRTNDAALIYSLNTALSGRYTHVLIAGDFNVPSLFRNPSPSDQFTKELQNLIHTYPLYNHTKNPLVTGYPLQRLIWIYYSPTKN